MQPGRLEGYHEAHQLDSALVDTDAMMTETKREERGREKARRCRPSLPLRSARGCGGPGIWDLGVSKPIRRTLPGSVLGPAYVHTGHSALTRCTKTQARALRKKFNVPAHEDWDASICNVVGLVCLFAHMQRQRQRHERLSCENWRQRLRLDARFSVVALDHHCQN